MKLAHIRHPLSRLYSAWRQKFRKNHETIQFFTKKYGNAIDKLYGTQPAENHTVTFENFIKYVAYTKQDRRFDVHWTTFQYYCAPCIVDYDVITQTESQDADMEFVLSSKMLDREPNRTEFLTTTKPKTQNSRARDEQHDTEVSAWDYLSQYIPRQYSDSPMRSSTIERLYERVETETLAELKKVYYWDFELFNFTVPRL